MKLFSLATLAVVADATNSSTTYWWMYHNKDCGYDDVKPTCAGKSVAECKTLCLATDGCGGFNYPHGILKKTDCLSKMATSTVDLYLVEDKPQPPPPPPAANFPPVWPIPAKFVNGTSALTVSPKLVFDCQQKVGMLDRAFARYQASMFPHEAAPASKDGALLSTVNVAVTSTDESHPQLETAEDYTLDIGIDGKTSITASTVYGVLHALETLSQLVVFDFETEMYSVAHAPWSIQDEPRFPHRGLMMDTGRHFQTLDSIRNVISSLPYSKVNVLHWHMSDSQSFPMQSMTYPKLWEGAWSEQERYTQADIAEIVAYAKDRGVRVMVEFDMPGHAAAWCPGYPEVCPSASCTQPLNVANNATFDLITSLLGEMTGKKSSTSGNPSGLFPENLIHLGGDEVNTACWTKSPTISAWLKERNMTADDGYAYFVKRAASIALAQGRSPVQWVEVFDHFGTKLDKRTIVHVWKAKSTLQAVVAAGYRALINNSPGSNSWYLDHLTVNWESVYSNEPCEGIPAEQCKLVLGGQGEMWGETVDVSDIDSTVWPRMAAIGERLWSPQAAVDAAQTDGTAHKRISAFRCLLNRRGIRAAPVNNAGARSAPPGAGGCYDQR
jgi:hexosaminidase